MKTSEVFWSRVKKLKNGCWIYGSGKSYGIFSYTIIRKGVSIKITEGAHKYAYKLMTGPIRAGQEIHHTCRNHSCVNPKHLVSVSQEDHGKLHTGDKRRVKPSSST